MTFTLNWVSTNFHRQFLPVWDVYIYHVKLSVIFRTTTLIHEVYRLWSPSVRIEESLIDKLKSKKDDLRFSLGTVAKN